MNKAEFNKIFIKYKIIGKNLLVKLTKFQKIFKIKCLVIKTGSKGCSVFKNGQIINSLPSKKTNSPLNTIGAGDYFLAGFVYNNQKNLVKRMQISNSYAFSKIIGKRKLINLN